MATTDNPAVRAARKRPLVESLFAEQTGFLSAQQAYDQLRAKAVAISLPTVYRTLQAMAEAGQLDVVQTDTHETVYRRCAPGHHHHLICTGCGSVTEVAGAAVEGWIADIAQANGFAVSDHRIEIYGLCASCQANAEAPPAASLTAPA
jgi:Fur family ferric uptake transcriptional regulator